MAPERYTWIMSIARVLIVVLIGVMPILCLAQRDNLKSKSNLL